ncbi:MAG: hypothetical protein P1P65_09785 [Treponema sp.]
MHGLGKIKKFCFIVVCLLAAGSAALFAQTVSGKKDIAVFRLSHFGGIPYETAQRLDSHITAVITSFKRFNVIGMQYRLKSSDINLFIEKIKETKEQQSDIPETVLSGEEAFTRADWERLTGAFLVFIPQITRYDEEIRYRDAVVDGKEVRQKYWEVKIDAAITIIDVSGAAGQRVLPISVQETAKYRSDAVDDAVDAVGNALYAVIKFEPEFALASGIVEIDRRSNTLIMQLGRDMGIREGDEYIIQKPVSGGGLQSLREAGFFIVSEVHDGFSVGKIIYATQPVVEGDSVKESPRLNLDLQGYGGITVPITGIKEKRNSEYLRIQPTFGIRAVYRTSFHLGLLLGYEYAIQQPAGSPAALKAKPLGFTPFGMGYIGINVYNFYASRFKISPELHFCFAAIGVYAQPQNAFGTQRQGLITASQFGGRAGISADYFVTRTFTIGMNTAIGYMHNTMSAQQAADKLRGSGALKTDDSARVPVYNWDILTSHLNFYLFLGITKRL